MIHTWSPPNTCIRSVPTTSRWSMRMIHTFWSVLRTSRLLAAEFERGLKRAPWASKSNLRLNPSKTRELVIYYRNKPGFDQLGPSTLAGAEWVVSMRVLGIDVRANLSVEPTWMWSTPIAPPRYMPCACYGPTGSPSFSSRRWPERPLLPPSCTPHQLGGASGPSAIERGWNAWWGGCGGGGISQRISFHLHFVYWNTQKIELQLSQPQLEFWLHISKSISLKLISLCTQPSTISYGLKIQFQCRNAWRLSHTKRTS